MRLDDVEIKLTFPGSEIENAMEALQLPSDRPGWQIYFCEDVNAGVGVKTPLLDLGVILRARVRPDEEDDVTVKLRPCRRSQITARWLGDTDHVKVEADWADDRHVLAVSNTDERPTGLIPAVAADQRPLSDLLTHRQQEFLMDCAGAAVNLDTVSALPVIRAVRWKSVPVAPAGLHLRAERWTVDPLDFLELSVVASVDEARDRQDAMVRFVDSIGLEVPGNSESKTQQVVRQLVTQRLGLVS